MLIFAGILFMLFMFAFVGGMGDILLNLVDFPSFMLVLVPLLFFLCVTKSGGIIARYIRLSFKKKHEYTKAELESIVAAVKSTIRFTNAMGGFGVMIGFIASLAQLQMEIPGLLAANLAVSLITLLYSISISFFVFFPLQAWAEIKIKNHRQSGNSPV